MSNLYVTVVIDLDDGQGTRGIGPVTTWPGWDGTATIGLISIPQTATLTGTPEEAATPPTIRVRASDDPLLIAPLRHYWEEALTNVGGQNPPVYSGLINHADGATQYLSVLRMAALTTDPPTPGVVYLTRAEWLAANGYAHPDGTTITQAEDGTLTAVGALAQAQQLAAWARGQAFTATAPTYDNTYTHVVSSAPVVWPDGSAGTYTTDYIDPTWQSADAWHISHDDSGLTVTQAAITRDGDGDITAIPVLTVA